MASEQLQLAEESQALAKEAVEQSIQRQQLGTAMPFEVFQAQEIYLRAGSTISTPLPAITNPNTAFILRWEITSKYSNVTPVSGMGGPKTFYQQTQTQ